MNCDQVFDILTRGPFPNGEPTDAAVERHLGCCHECRQLAEALRPAVELFHECITAEEAAELPGYHGAHAGSESGLSAQSHVGAATLVRPAISAWSRPTWRASSPARSTVMRVAAAGVLLVAICVLLFGLGREATTDESTSLADATAASPNFDANLRETLAPFRLPEDCFVPLQLDATNRGAQCCTRCHSSALSHTPHLAKARIADLTRSCQACHES